MKVLALSSSCEVSTWTSLIGLTILVKAVVKKIDYETLLRDCH